MDLLSIEAIRQLADLENVADRRHGDSGDNSRRSAAGCFERCTNRLLRPTRQCVARASVRQRGNFGSQWVAFNRGMYFLDHGGGRSALKFLDFRTRRTSELIEVDKTWNVSALAASPDGRRLLFDQIDQNASDLMLVEDFR
jgi:hypothetical protein